MKNIAASWSLLRHKGLILCAILFFITGLIRLHAQTAIVSAGGNSDSPGQGSVCYTIGQVAFTIVSDAAGSIAQGVQQPYEISVISGFDEANDIDLQVTSYPNPVTDLLKLRLPTTKTTELICNLYDINGNLLERIEISSIETTIDMSQLAPSVYYLEVTENHSILKSFKITKY